MADAVIFAFGENRSVGSYRVANEIRNLGFSCQVISMINQYQFDDLKAFCEKFIDANTKMIGFSTVFWQPETTHAYIAIRTVLKDIDTNGKIVMGGNRGKEVAMLTSDPVHAIVYGQGDVLITQLMKSYTSSFKMIEPTEVFNGIPVYVSENRLAGWDFGVSKTLYEQSDCVLPGETLVFEVSRGCIFRCKFCAFPLNGKKKTDFVKTKEILQAELTDNYTRHGVTHYILSDDTFNDSMEKMKFLHEVFTSLPFKITFTTYARLDLIYAHREQINLLEEMGMVGVHFGIESFHEKASRVIGKGTPGETSKKFLQELKTIHWKDRVKIGISLIQGLPHETHESYAETVNWVKDAENQVDTVAGFRLGVCDPTRYSLPFRSEFQNNPAKYGFYWPDRNDPWVWKNFIGPVKSREEAQLLTNELVTASALNNRHPGHGSFFLSRANTTGKYCDDPKTLPDFLKMDRHTFTSWWRVNYSISYRNYLTKYRDKLLNL